MSRVMYRPGGTQDIWGIKCDVHTFKDEEIESAITDGWCSSPEDFEKTEDEVRLSVFPPDVQDVAEKMQEDLTRAVEIADGEGKRADAAEALAEGLEQKLAELESTSGNLGDMIRKACEDRGIDKFGNMAIDTLIDKLEAPIEGSTDQ